MENTFKSLTPRGKIFFNNFVIGKDFISFFNCMPEAFLKCIATKGSQKFTKSLPKGKYVHGCKLPGSKDAVWGEIKTKKSARLSQVQSKVKKLRSRKG